MIEDPVEENIPGIPEYVWVDPDLVDETDDEDDDTFVEEEDENEEPEITFVIDCIADDDGIYTCTNCTTNATSGIENCTEYISDSYITYQTKEYRLYRNSSKEPCHYMMDRSSKIDWSTIYISMRYSYFYQ